MRDGYYVVKLTMLSRRGRPLGVAGCCVVIACVSARSAAAQPTAPAHPYVSASLLGEVKRFSGDVATNVFDGEDLGGAIAVGTRLASRVELELGVDVPRGSTDRQPRMVTFQRSTFTFQSTTTSRTVKVSTVLRLLSERHGRVRLGYLAGLSIVRFRRRFDAEGTDGIPASLIPRPQELVDYSAAPTVGLDADVVLSRHLSVVPAIRATAFGYRDGSSLLVTTRAAVRWTF